MGARSVGKPQAPKKTKDRILDAAQRLFAEKGLDATSIRDITEAAQANLASINYHFGGKDGLIKAVFARHLGPLNAARLEMLDAAMEKAGQGPPSIEEVLKAFIRPVVLHHLAPSQDAQAFTQILGRCLSEPITHLEHIRLHFDDLMERFRAAVASALPELSEDEAFWRLHFALGTMHHTLHMWSRMDHIPHRPAQTLDAEGLAQRLVAFTAAGMRSPLAKQDPSPPAPAPARPGRRRLARRGSAAR